MKFSACAAAVAMALSVVHAWTFNVSEVATPIDNMGEHQTLQRSWTISSFAQIQQLYLAVPGRVFVELDPSLLPVAESPATEVPVTKDPGVPGVIPGVTPGVLPGVVPGVKPGFVPGEDNTKAPPSEVPTPEEPKVPGVIPGVTPGDLPGVVPGVKPGFVPGEDNTKAPPSEVPTPEDPGVPGVIPGVTPGDLPGVVPGVKPGFVPGEDNTKAPPSEVPTPEEPKVPGVIPGVTPGDLPGVVPGVKPGFVPGSAPAGSLNETGLEWNVGTVADKIPTTMMRKHRRNHEDDDDDQSQDDDTIVAKIVITGNSTDLLNMIEALPLSKHRNDGLKLHLRNRDAYAEGYVLTKIYLFKRNLLRRVTTAFSGDVVLNDDVVTLDDADADVKFACVGDGNLYLDSGSNATLGSLDIEVTGSGLAQLTIPSVNIDAKLDMEVAGSGAVALITNTLSAGAVKSTLSGSGAIVVDTSNLTASKLEASVYGSGVASFATAGSVDKESLTLSGPGQLLAGSIVAESSNVDVWGDGELLVQATDRLTVSTSVWGKVGYVNSRPADVKIKGWWFWREASAIVYPAAVNKVVIYEPAIVPAKSPVYYSIETVNSTLSDEPDFAFVSVGPSNVVDQMTTSLSHVQSTYATSSSSHSFLYALGGAGVVMVNVVAARSWAKRRIRRQYTLLV